MEPRGEVSLLPGTEVPESLLVSRPGGEQVSTASHSHFLEPVLSSNRKLFGRSRRWGDIDQSSQRQVIGTLITEAKRQGCSLEETALVLAVARVESGFNPDAASQSTSATGIGQFIDKTGRAYGITSRNRFDLKDNARAMIHHLKDMLRLAGHRFGDLSKQQRLCTAYALYHDGPSLKYGGHRIALNSVLPWTEKFYQWLSSIRGGVVRPTVQ